MDLNFKRVASVGLGLGLGMGLGLGLVLGLGLGLVLVLVLGLGLGLGQVSLVQCLPQAVELTPHVPFVPIPCIFLLL